MTNTWTDTPGAFIVSTWQDWKPDFLSLSQSCYQSSHVERKKRGHCKVEEYWFVVIPVSISQVDQEDLISTHLIKHTLLTFSPTETTTQRHDSEVAFEAWAGEIELFGSCHVGVYCVPFKRKASLFTLVICFRVHMHNKIHIQSDKSWFYRTRLLCKAVSQVLYCVSRRTHGLKINYLGVFLDTARRSVILSCAHCHNDASAWTW